MICSANTNRMIRHLVAAATLLTVMPVSSGVRAADADAGPFAGLSGSWAGDGSVTMTDGTHESIRCRATYSVPPSGQALNQGLRCGSQSYTFDVKSSVTVSDGGRLSGSWSEATRQVVGDVNGSVTPGHIETSVETLGFSAQLSVTTKGAHQSVSIQPQGTDVQAVTIEMRRI